MSELNCERCGAALPYGSKFCRQCGQPLLRTQTTSVTDVTTRSLGGFAAGEAPTQHFQATPPTAAPLATHARGGFSTAPTGAIAPRRRRRPVLLLGVVTIGLIAFLAVLAMTFAARRQSRLRRLAPPPQPARAPRGESPVLAGLVYPGAAVVMDMRSADQGDMMQLRTDDPFDKVVNWYEGRLKATERVRVPGANVIFKNDEVNVIITNAGSGTDILVKEERDE